MKNVAKTNKRTEVYEYIHKGISVFVWIDYFNNKISLLEQDNFVRPKEKHWVFAERGVEYMNGWLNILEAMQEAVKDAKKRYEANLAEVSKFNIDFVKK